jgi:hypothetical protein
VLRNPNAASAQRRTTGSQSSAGQRVSSAVNTSANGIEKPT